MLRKHAMRVFAVAAVTFGLACQAAWATTRIGSIAVSATVVAGCNVTPGAATLESTISGQANWTTTTAVNCSMPVGYQIMVNGSAANGNSGAGFAETAAAAMSGYALSRSLNFFRVVGLPSGQYLWTGQPDADLVRYDSSGSNMRLVDFAQMLWPDPDSGRVIVTIVY